MIIHFLLAFYLSSNLAFQTENEFSLDKVFTQSLKSIAQADFSNDGTAVIVSTGNKVQAIQIEDGASLWSFTTNVSRAVFFIGPDNQLWVHTAIDTIVCLDMVSGDVLKTVALAEEVSIAGGNRYRTHPILKQGQIYFADFHMKKIKKVDLETGIIELLFDYDVASKSQPAIFAKSRVPRVQPILVSGNHLLVIANQKLTSVSIETHKAKLVDEHLLFDASYQMPNQKSQPAVLLSNSGKLVQVEFSNKGAQIKSIATQVLGDGFGFTNHEKLQCVFRVLTSGLNQPSILSVEDYDGKNKLKVKCCENEAASLKFHADGNVLVYSFSGELAVFKTSRKALITTK